MGLTQENCHADGIFFLFCCLLVVVARGVVWGEGEGARGGEGRP